MTDSEAKWSDVNDRTSFCQPEQFAYDSVSLNMLIEFGDAFDYSGLAQAPSRAPTA